jgi:hypothetical protein
VPLLWTAFIDMPPTQYFAYHVDLSGVALASYQLRAADDEGAASEARWLLKLHPSLEVWQGARFVVRLVREEPAGLRGH